jgi:hypothetical protein
MGGGGGERWEGGGWLVGDKVTLKMSSRPVMCCMSTHSITCARVWGGGVEGGRGGVESGQSWTHIEGVLQCEDVHQRYVA